MEQQVLDLLQATTTPNTQTVQNAEAALLNLFPNPEFPFYLLLIASHTDVEPGFRKAALTTLKNYVQSTWSSQFDETFKGQIYLSDEAKGRVREQLFALCTNASVDANAEQNIQALAAAITSRIASVDFPDNWPTLFPTLLEILAGTSSDPQILGALRVLSELIDSGFTEDQFFVIARDLVNALKQVATATNRKPNVRAVAMSVFRSCFDMLEMVMEDHKAAVKAFLDESLKQWMPFFLETVKSEMPQIPSKDDEINNNDILAQWKGVISLKVQVVKTLDKIRTVFIQGLSQHAVVLFQAIWEELARLTPAYREFFIDNDRGGKSFDGDGLPYTLDSLILEELDFLQVTFRAPPVKSELDQGLKAAPEGSHTAGWLQELIKLLVAYAQIPNEEEGLWEWDPNLYLCEATAITANYTPRAACAELATRGLSEWLRLVSVDAVLYYCQRSFSTSATTAKEREAVLFILKELLRDAEETSSKLSIPTTQGLLQIISPGGQDGNIFMRAGAAMVLGILFKVSDDSFRDLAAQYLQNSIQSAISDEADVVKVACIKVIQEYIMLLPHTTKQQFQSPIITAISEFISSHDLRDELEDADDVKGALIETLRDAILLNTINAIDNTPALDLFFTLASDAAPNFQLFTLLTESFENIVEDVTVSGQHDPYVRLCTKTIPSLAGAFDVANMTQESALTNLAAELVSSLADYGIEPLPDGFVSAVMPKLHRVLMEATDAELVRPATTAVKHMLKKGTAQYLAWTDPATGKSSIETTLIIINRLLNSPDVEEAAADEVGGLALELVNKAGADKLGSYLMELLRAVVIRLASAERAAFMQSLLMVFAGLSVAAPKEVIDFLSELNINGQSGLSVVLPKWLENSISFAGFEEIRQNVVALSKIYSLDDERVKTTGVRGELIVENTGRIKTRSQARLNPDRYTNIPASLKILKVLVEELNSAATSKFASTAEAQAAAAALDSEGSEDGDDWEDVGSGGAIDLGSLAQKEHLMAWGNDESPTSERARDDETAEYLAGWFRGESQKAQFQADYAMLSEEERGKLSSLG